MEFVIKNCVTGENINFFDFQNDLIDKMDVYDNNVFITSRQLGMSTLLKYKAIKNVLEGKIVLYKSYKTPHERYFIRDIKRILVDSGYDVNGGCNNVFINDGLITIDNTISSCDLLLSDGVKIPDNISFNKSVTIMLPYQNISEMIGSYNKTFNIEVLKYDLVSGRNEIWRSEMIKNLGIENFNREYIS